MMKTFLKIIAGIAAVIALAIWAIFYFTGGIVETGDQFFQALKENDVSRAYSYLSKDFKASTQEGEFKAFVERNSLTNIKESSWSSRSINGGRGELAGTVSTDDGGVIPLKLSFVKGNDGWRIYSIQKPPSGLRESDEGLPIPSESEQVEMVKKAARDFAAAVSIKSSAEFRETFSSLFKQQFTVERLDEAYRSFYDAGLDLSILERYSPVFDGRPTIDEDGVMTITGYFPTKPQKFYFDQTYIYEGLGWKLLGYSVNVK